MQASLRDQPANKISCARSIDAGCRHDACLAEAVRFGDRLKDRKLARCESIADMTREHAVRPLAGAMQQVQDGPERGRRRPGSLGHDIP